MKVGVSRDKKREVCVLFLVPGPRGEIEHRWVGGMVVHLNNGEEKGMEDVASQYWYGWEDWAVSQPWDYVKEDDKEQVKITEEVPWRDVMGRLAEVIGSVGGCASSRSEFDTHMQRVVC